MSPEEEMTVT